MTEQGARQGLNTEAQLGHIGAISEAGKCRIGEAHQGNHEGGETLGTTENNISQSTKIHGIMTESLSL